MIFIVLVFLLFGPASFYVGHRLWGCIRQFAPKLPRWTRWLFAGFSAALLALVFIRSGVTGSLFLALGTAGAYWMGFFIYLLLFLLLSELVLLILRLFLGKTTQLRRCIAGLAALGLALGISVYGFVHGMELETVSYDITVDKPMDAPLELVLISDLHLGAAGSETRLEKTVAQINGMDPALICIAGDVFDSNFAAIQNPERVQALLRSLNAPVYACLGNHDAGATAGQMVAFLESCQVTVLEDSYTVIDDRLLLVGRLDARPIGSYGEKQQRSALETVLQDANTALPVVVMDHNPIHIGEYAAPVDLILSGHTHKGQLFPAGIITDLMYPADYGYYRESPDSPQLIVSSGAGAWGMPMRVGSDCEIVSVTIHS